MRKLTPMLAVIAVLCLGLTVIPAGAEFYNFMPISTDNPTDCPTGAAQFKLFVEEIGSYASFNFINNGPLDSVISEVYFYDNASGLLEYGSAVIDNNINTNFVFPAVPADLPGIVGFAPAAPPADYSAGGVADPPDFAGVPEAGVGPFESVGIRIPIAGGATFADVIAALNLGAGNPAFPAGGILVGAHGIALAPGDGSCSYVTAPIPIPGTLMLLGTGILGLAALRRKLQ